MRAAKRRCEVAGANARAFAGLAQIPILDRMNRYFLDSAILDEGSIRLDRNDAFVPWKIEPAEHGLQASRILFDFSQGFDRAVNNAVRHRIVFKANFDGLIADVILRSDKCREVERAEF